MKKLIVINNLEKEKHPDKMPVWWKIDKYFIAQDNIHSLSRKGRKTVIRMYHGEDILVNVNYDKLSVLFPQPGKI